MGQRYLCQNQEYTQSHGRVSFRKIEQAQMLNEHKDIYRIDIHLSVLAYITFIKKPR
jgi:hypothetical protein